MAKDKGIIQETSVSPVKEYYECVWDGITDISESESSPEDFMLFQNFPNPFNPNTSISYQLPKDSYVTLKIYDVLGNDIIILVDEYKQSGTYTANFDATKLSTGVYLYKIKSGEFISSRKMILMK